MAAIAFPEHAKSVTLSTGTTYSYVSIAAQPSKSTILFLHGFPSSCLDWYFQIPYFSSKGYGIIAPDLLGYGGTDKPTTLEPYIFKTMASEIAQILDHEKIEKVHGVAHDFGGFFMSQVINYHPKRFLSAAWLATPYSPPGTPLAIDQMGKFSREKWGFNVFGYMRLFFEDDSWKLLDEHKESMFTVGYGPQAEIWMHLHPDGALKAWLEEDKKAAYPTWITLDYKMKRDRIFKDGGYRGPTNWYRSRFHKGLEIEEEKGEVSEKLPCRALFVDHSEDSAVNFPFSAERMKEYTDKFTVKRVSTPGHWIQLEARDEVNQILEEFLEEE